MNSTQTVKPVVHTIALMLKMLSCVEQTERKHLLKDETHGAKTDTKKLSEEQRKDRRVVLEEFKSVIGAVMRARARTLDK